MTNLNKFITPYIDVLFELHLRDIHSKSAIVKFLLDDKNYEVAKVVAKMSDAEWAAAVFEMTICVTELIENSNINKGKAA